MLRNLLFQDSFGLHIFAQVVCLDCCFSPLMMDSISRPVIKKLLLLALVCCSMSYLSVEGTA